MRDIGDIDRYVPALIGSIPLQCEAVIHISAAWRINVKGETFKALALTGGM